MDAGQSEALTVRWDLLVWLLLAGFVGCTTVGFSLHLFPAISHRVASRHIWEVVACVALQAGVVLGAISLASRGGSPIPGVWFSVGALLVLIAFSAVVGGFVALTSPPRHPDAVVARRPGDSVSIPLFVSSWLSAIAAAGMFVVAGREVGPGFGWWLSAVHFFVLGHVTLLIAAVTLRLVPRAIDADLPRVAVGLLAGLGLAGAMLVPLGMLALPPSTARALDLLAAPEAAFALLFVSLLVYALFVGKVHRPTVGLNLGAAVLLLAGGGLGLYMVSREDFGPVSTHALLNVLGFVGLTVITMWFSMIAPFQRISHAWTRRMLWALSFGWLAATALLSWAASQGPSKPPLVASVGGAVLLCAAIVWGVGTIPVLFPRLNPLPGLSPERIRILRSRWGRR